MKIDKALISELSKNHGEGVVAMAFWDHGNIETPEQLKESIKEVETVLVKMPEDLQKQLRVSRPPYDKYQEYKKYKDNFNSNSAQQPSESNEQEATLEDLVQEINAANEQAEKPETPPAEEPNQPVNVTKEAAPKKEIDPKILDAINNLKGLPDIASKIESEIYKLYNTSAVKYLDLENELDGCEALNLEVYEKPCYAIALQLETDHVRQAIEACKSKWESTDYALNIIRDYCDKKGIPAEQLDEEIDHLISLLDEHTKNEDSPRIYKAYKSLTMGATSSGNKTNEEVFSDPEASAAYMAGMENYKEEEVPVELANAVASDDAMEVKKRKGISGLAGTMVGSAVKLKYSTAENYEENLKNAMGKYADRYDQDKQAAMERKDEVKANRQEKIKKLANMRVKQPTADNPMSQMQHQTQYQQPSRQQYAQSNMRLNPNRTPVNTNFSPSIPVWLIVSAFHFLIIVIIALVVGWGRTVLPAFGLILASYGFFSLKAKGVTALATIVGGYAIAAITVLII